MVKKIINNILRFIVNYPDQTMFAIFCVYSIIQKMQILAVIFLLLAIIGLERFKKFILSVLSKIEESEEVRIGNILLIKARTSSLPIDALKLEERSGVPLEFYSNFDQGQILLRQGNIKGAKEALEEALKFNQKNHETLVSLGLIYNMLRENEKSIEASKAALKVRPNSFVPQFNLAVATNHLLGSEKSIQEYLKAEEIVKETGMGETVTVGKLNLFLGHDYRELGEIEEVRRRYKKAKEIFSMYNTAEADFWLKDTNANIKKLEKNEK